MGWGEVVPRLTRYEAKAFVGIRGTGFVNISAKTGWNRGRLRRRIGAAKEPHN